MADDKPPYGFYAFLATLAFAGVCLAHLAFLAYLAWKKNQVAGAEKLSAQELRKYGVIP